MSNRALPQYFPATDTDFQTFPFWTENIWNAAFISWFIVPLNHRS